MKKIKMKKVFLISLISITVFLSSGTVFAEESVNTQASTGTITFSVEKFTLGEGYYVEPCQIPIYSGDRGITVLNRYFGESNLRWKANYLQGVYGAQTGTLNVPACISKMPSHIDFGAAPTTESASAVGLTYPGQLSEKDYSPMSGWMYSVNNTFPGYGFDGYTPADGDVLRMQFTLWGYGADLGQDFQGGMTPINTVDKTSLTALLAKLNSSANISQYKQNATFNAAYTKAYGVMQNLEATRKQVGDMYSELEAAIPAAPINLASISVSPATLALKAGQTQALAVTCLPENATVDKSVTWKSSDNSVATVASNGTVTAVSAGTANIVATSVSGGLTSQCSVTVSSSGSVEKPITGIQVSTSFLSLKKSQTSQLSVSYQPADTTDIKAVEWISSDSSVATVTSTGLVTGVAKGKATITAITANGNTSSCYVTISDTEKPITEIQLNTKALSLKKSQTSQLNAAYLPADTTDVKTVVWTSSDNKVATVSATGMVTAVGEGSTTITATTAAGLKADCKVTVSAGEFAAVNCTYRTHVENDGWQDWRSNGAMSGTTARSLRLEGIELKLADTSADLGIQYQTHIENIGWEDGWKSNGTMSGTTARSLRLEAIRIQLTGNDADKYDVYYQVHAQNIGWMGWAKNGASSGTAGFAYRLEGIKIVVVPKGETPPTTTINQPLSFIKNS